MLSFFRKYIHTIKNWWKFYKNNFYLVNSGYTCKYCYFRTYMIYVRKYRESPFMKEKRYYFERLIYFSLEDKKKVELKQEQDDYIHYMDRSYVCLNCEIMSHDSSAEYDDTSISIDEFYRQNINE